MKALFSFLSDACWRLGFNDLSMRFLLASLSSDDGRPPTKIAWHKPSADSTPVPWSFDVIFEDKGLVTELGDRLTSAVKRYDRVRDVN